MAEGVKDAVSIEDMLAEGHAYLEVNDFTAAVRVLAKACKKVTLDYGQLSDECAEPYLWYGKALLGRSKILSAQAIEDSDDGDTESDEETESIDSAENVEGVGSAEDADIAEETDIADRAEDSEYAKGAVGAECTEHSEGVKDKTKEKREDNEKLDDGENKEDNGESGGEIEVDIEGIDEDWEIDTKSISNLSTMHEQNESIMEENNEADSATKAEKPGCGCADADKADTDDEPGSSDSESNELAEEEEDIYYLILAKNMLELSRTILMRNVTINRDRAGILLAEVHLALGEVSLGYDSRNEALKHMMTSLHLRKKLLASNDMRIADAHYRIGATYFGFRQYAYAIMHFNDAAIIVDSRMRSIDSVNNVPDDHETDNQVTSVNAEAKELRKLVLTIRLEIKDIAEFMSTVVLEANFISAMASHTGQEDMQPASPSIDQSQLVPSTSRQNPVSNQDGGSASGTAQSPTSGHNYSFTKILNIPKHKLNWSGESVKIIIKALEDDYDTIIYFDESSVYYVRLTIIGTTSSVAEVEIIMNDFIKRTEDSN